jgi:hypothetical protein
MIPAVWYLGRGEALEAKRAPNEGPSGNTHSQKMESKDGVKRWSQKMESKDGVKRWSQKMELKDGPASLPGSLSMSKSFCYALSLISKNYIY